MGNASQGGLIRSVCAAASLLTRVRGVLTYSYSPTSLSLSLVFSSPSFVVQSLVACCRPVLSLLLGRPLDLRAAESQRSSSPAVRVPSARSTPFTTTARILRL